MNARAVLINLALEDEPTVRVFAERFEDEERLRLWLEDPAAQERLTDALLQALREVTS